MESDIGVAPLYLLQEVLAGLVEHQVVIHHLHGDEAILLHKLDRDGTIILKAWERELWIGNIGDGSSHQHLLL